MMASFTKTRVFLSLLGSVLLLQACGDGSVAPPPPSPPPPAPAMATFSVTVLNLTNAQPLSPVAVIAHRDDYQFFSVGAPAGAGLQEMAEGGDNTTLLAEAGANAMVIAGSSGAAPIGPGGSETVTMTVLNSQRPGLQFSVATMLVNTNDAFTGLNSLAVETMAAGDSVTINGIAYDAGTEADSEQAIHIPGPAGGGEGFNAARDDEGDRVSMHPGVVSRDDGLASSDLSEQHRFDNPVIRIRIERIS